MSEPHIITLRRPVGPKGHEITELRLREPTAGEVLKASRETGRNMALSLLKQVTGVYAASKQDMAGRQAAIEALPGRISDQALDYFMTFIEPILAESDEPQTDPPEELTITLDETMEIGTTWVTELNLREPTLGELIKGEKYEGLQRTIIMVALVSGLPRAVIELVPISKFAGAAVFIKGFTNAAPSSGVGQLGA